MSMIEVMCGPCGGTGRVIVNPQFEFTVECDACQGYGLVDQKEEKEPDPPGIYDSLEMEHIYNDEDQYDVDGN